MNLNPDVLSSKTKGIKLSIKPPFDLADLSLYSFNQQKTLDYNNGIYMHQAKLRNMAQQYSTSPKFIDLSEYFPGTALKFLRTNLKRDENQQIIERDGLFLLTTEYRSPIPLVMPMDIGDFQFKKQDIIGANKNKKFNPKLNEQDYRSLNLPINGNAYEMPINKINTPRPEFEYYEQLTPEATKGLLRLKNRDDENSVFNPEYCKSFNGFSYQDDFTIAVAYSAYAEYIANNKNAYAQLNAQLTYNSNQTALTNAYIGANFAYGGLSRFGSFISGLASGGIVGGLQDSIGTVINEGVSYGRMKNQQYENNDKTQLQNNYEKTKFDFSIDNMKNAPTSVKNINGNAILTNMIAEFGIYAEIFEGLDTELESANDIMFRDGYNLNRFEEAGKSVKDYCHTRKYFNYIRATLGNISGVPMSDTMRADLKRRFDNGIRFWHQDTVDYTKENYELKIEQ